MKETTLRARLRQRLQEPGLVLAPGVFDMVSLRLADSFGVEALYMTGYGTVASHMGLPDAGLATYSDMVGRVTAMAGMAKTPLIADADTGYGGLLNMRHTLRGYEAAGAAAIQLEDQEFPKKCGHTPGRRVIAMEDMVRKIKVAVDARTDPNFLIIARTDALAVEGFEAAMARCQAYAQAGADMIFMEAPSLREHLEAVPRQIKVPTLYNMASSGKTPFLGIDEIGRMGYKLVIYPNFALLSAINAIEKTLATLHQTGTVAGIAPHITNFQQFFDLLGMREVQDLEARFGVDDTHRVGY